VFAIVQTDAGALINQRLDPVKVRIGPSKFTALDIRRASVLLKLT
jgi:hypothetical protein